MSKPKPPTKRPARGRKADDPGSPDAMLRGLTPDDLAALARAVSRRKAALDAAAPGAYLSRNAVLLSLLRAAMAAEDAAEAAAARGTP